MLPVALSLASLALSFYALIQSGVLFIDFQFQYGSFSWGKRFGTKRRSAQEAAARVERRG